MGIVVVVDIEGGLEEEGETEGRLEGHLDTFQVNKIDLGLSPNSNTIKEH